MKTKKKLELAEKLVELRANWTIEDYKEAYVDEWESIPESLGECKEKMEEYIHHTYEESYIEECVENESV